MELSEEQFERYARHLILDEVGEEGQLRLLQSRVLVVGAGGLGSPLLLYLAAAGVGTIGITDSDRVDLTNLQRQIVHATERVGALKVESARETLAAVNPGVRVEAHPVRLGPQNAAASVARALSTLSAPTRSVACTIWRCRLVRSTRSGSVIPIVPTPAAAR